MLEYFLLGDKWIQPSLDIFTFKNKYFVLGYFKWHLCGGLKEKS